jgi:NADPH:quinone reductase-like Zn-dependent oxidoreductase
MEARMTTTQIKSGLVLLSCLTSDGKLHLTLEERPVAAAGPGEIVVRVEASPINPSDLGLLLGPADPATASVAGTADKPGVSFSVPRERLVHFTKRLDQVMTVGNEGAGVVVAAGEGVKDYVGKTVATSGGAMYAEYRVVRAEDAMVLPAGATARDGASSFVNPLTALGMIETMRREGHKALVHTAAASNLGQMLVKVCIADGVGLVNVVRNQAQVDILRDLGAKHVVDSSGSNFIDELTEAVAETEATIAFDAIGGGKLASQILVSMERALGRKTNTYNRYGSAVHKQVYIYGGLDMSPTSIDRSIGMAWGVGGWLVTPFLQKAGTETVARLRSRVVSELKTTFASHYIAELSLRETLKPEIIAAYARRATGGKYLINPSKK